MGPRRFARWLSQQRRYRVGLRFRSNHTRKPRYDFSAYNDARTPAEGA